MAITHEEVVDLLGPLVTLAADAGDTATIRRIDEARAILLAVVDSGVTADDIDLRRTEKLRALAAALRAAGR